MEKVLAIQSALPDFTIGFLIKRVEEGGNYKFDWCVASKVKIHYSARKEDNNEEIERTGKQKKNQ